MKKIILIAMVAMIAMLGACGSEDAQTPPPYTVKDHYTVRLESFRAGMSNGSVIFMGDSITELCGIYNPDFFEGDNVNRGISGAGVKEMLRLTDDIILDEQPRMIQLLIGVNDRPGTNDYPANMVKLIDNLRAGIPDVHIRLVSQLPSSNWLLAETAARNEFLSNLVGMYADNIEFVDLYYEFITPEGNRNYNLMPDGTHLNLAGCMLVFTEGL